MAFIRGATNIIEIEVLKKNDDGTTEPYVMINDLYYEIARSPEHKKAFLIVESDQIEVIDDGLVEVTVTPEQSKEVFQGTWYHELYEIDDSGVKNRLFGETSLEVDPSRLMFHSTVED